MFYNLSLNADLVVLSACETGQGEFLRSEGPVSLGRAFFYGGAKSIFNTLWSVDDASTGQLITHFYQELKGHSSKSAALRTAKLSLIEDGEYAHPFYWSAFMLIGNRDAIDYRGVCKLAATFWSFDYLYYWVFIFLRKVGIFRNKMNKMT